MKKSLFALCAIAVLMATGCKKDEPVKPHHDSDIPQDTREGVYMPEKKIDTILYDGQVGEVWLWENGKVQSILTPNDNGVLTESRSFNYDGNRLSSMTTVLASLPVRAAYTYSGDYLNRVTVSNNNTQLVGVEVQHADGKINHADLNLNSEYLTEILDFIDPEMIPDSMIINIDSVSINVSNLLSSATEFLSSVEDLQASADLQWQDQNVSTMMLNLSFRASTTLGDVLSVIGDLSVFGQYASILAAMPPEMPIILQVAVKDTNEYFYDQQHNPFQKYLGQIDVPATLSSNNVRSQQHNGMINLTVIASIFGYETPIWSPSFPIPSSFTSYIYEYDNGGYPVRVTDNDGKVTQYRYAK